MFIKEGAATDFTHQEGLLKLLRFESNRQEPGEFVSLADYVGRMQDDQKGIYYVSGSNRETIECSPYLESFKGKDIEVLYCYDPVDDYIFDRVHEFEGKSIISAEQDNLDLPSVENDLQDAEAETLAEEEIKVLTEWLKQTLWSKVSEVRLSKRLKDSPAMVLSSYSTHSMQRIMQMMNKESSSPMPGILEINTKHKIIQGLNELRKKDDNFATVAAEQILETAQIAAGLIIDPRGMVNRLYSILERAVN
jgi:molecular chaperone HtpG